MPAPIGFNEEGIEKIKRSVEYTERQPDNPILPRSNRGFSSDDRWAILTDTDGSGKYSWQSLEATASLDMTANADWLSGNYDDDANYAVASSGCKDCVIGHKVYLTPAKSQDYFLFGYDRHISGTTDGTISGRNGTVAGVGLVIPDLLDGDTGQYTAASSQSFPVYNPFQGTVEDGKVVQMHINGSVWEITSDDCIESDGT